MSPKGRCIPPRSPSFAKLSLTLKLLETVHRGREKLKSKPSSTQWTCVMGKGRCKNDMLKLSSSALRLFSSDFNAIFDLQLTWPLNMKSYSIWFRIYPTQ